MTTYPFLNQEIAFSALACTQRSASEGELLLALIHCGPILPNQGAVVQENGLPPVAPVHDVVNRARILNSKLPGHPAGQLAWSLNPRQAPSQELVKISGSDPNGA